MNILNSFFIVLFVLSAALQYNDPDPVVWMTIYLYGALASYLAIKQKLKRWHCLAGLGAYTLYAIYLLFQPDGVISWYNEHHAENIAQTMKAEKPWIETTREFFGLILLITVLAVNLVKLPKTGSLSPQLKKQPS